MSMLVAFFALGAALVAAWYAGSADAVARDLERRVRALERGEKP